MGDAEPVLPPVSCSLDSLILVYAIIFCCHLFEPHSHSFTQNQSSRRYMNGAATNPDAHVFAYGAAQVKKVMDVTHTLEGKNLVFWGGREGYQSILNVDIKRWVSD